MSQNALSTVYGSTIRRELIHFSWLFLRVRSGKNITSSVPWDHPNTLKYYLIPLTGIRLGLISDAWGVPKEKQRVNWTISKRTAFTPPRPQFKTNFVSYAVIAGRQPLSQREIYDPKLICRCSLSADVRCSTAFFFQYQ